LWDSQLTRAALPEETGEDLTFAFYSL